jgi:hypothetical protein
LVGSMHGPKAVPFKNGNFPWPERQSMAQGLPGPMR